MRIVLIIILLTILNAPKAFGQELLLTPPEPSGLQIQKAKEGVPFSPGWNYFKVGFNGCTTLNVLNELAADGGSALSVDGLFVKNLLNWESYTFQSPKQKKIGADDTLAFNSNQKFFLQIDQSVCTSPNSERQAQIEKVKQTQTAKENFLDQVSQLPVDLWTKLTNILKNEGPVLNSESKIQSSGLDNLTIGGKTTVNDLGITGVVTAGLLSIDGLNGSIGSLSELKFKLPGGSLTIDKNGDLKVKKLFIDESSDSIGSGTIKAGGTSVDVKTSSVTSSSKIFVTATSETGGQSLIVRNKTAGGGFRVVIEKAYSSDISFDWMIVN